VAFQSGQSDMQVAEVCTGTIVSETVEDFVHPPIRWRALKGLRGFGVERRTQLVDMTTAEGAGQIRVARPLDDRVQRRHGAGYGSAQVLLILDSAWVGTLDVDLDLGYQGGDGAQGGKEGCEHGHESADGDARRQRNVHDRVSPGLADDQPPNVALGDDTLDSAYQLTAGDANALGNAAVVAIVVHCSVVLMLVERRRDASATQARVRQAGEFLWRKYSATDRGLANAAGAQRI
jgi:hypothetical protein